MRQTAADTGGKKSVSMVLKRLRVLESH
eukprot:SAG31_NODE_18053_length_648_cov_1.096539_1_plen_27_part_01